MVLVSKPTTATAGSSGAAGKSASVARRWNPPKTSPFSPIAAKAVTETVRARIDTIRRITTRRLSVSPPSLLGRAANSAARMTPTASRAGNNATDAPRAGRRVHHRRPGDRGRALGGAAGPHHRGAVAPG